MYTAQIILLSGKGIITNAIVDLLPASYQVQQIYFSDDGIFQVIQQEEPSLAKADVIILNLSEMNTNVEDTVSVLNQLHKQTPIIVLHLYHEKTFADAFLKMGASAYLPVNFNPEELLNIIENVLKKKSDYSINTYSLR